MWWIGQRPSQYSRPMGPDGSKIMVQLRVNGATSVQLNSIRARPNRNDVPRRRTRWESIGSDFHCHRGVAIHQRPHCGKVNAT